MTSDNVSLRNYASVFKLASKSLYVRDRALIMFKLKYGRINGRGVITALMGSKSAFLNATKHPFERFIGTRITSKILRCILKCERHFCALVSLFFPRDLRVAGILTMSLCNIRCLEIPDTHMIREKVTAKL